MTKNFTHVLCLILLTCCFMGTTAMAQNVTVGGSIVDKQTRAALPGVGVSVKGKSIGASTDANGRFKFTVPGQGPFTIVISYVGYKSIEREVSTSMSNMEIELEQQSVLGQEVVVAASRTPERILESPVSIERLGASAIKEIATPSFYDALSNIKGVESSAQSLTFRSINTRGFNSNGNTRFNQFVDGMDNQAPGLNFSVGNIIGLSELDLDNVELLPGASSALYGAGGINGTMLMNSKSPFTYQGVSMQFKTGINHVDGKQRPLSQFEDMSLRIAKAWNNKFAFKVNVSYLQAKDWEGQNYENFDRTARMVKSGDRNSDPNYDGINTYGDEVNQNMRGLAFTVQNRTRAGIAAATGGAIPDIVAMMNGALPANASPAQIGGFLGALPAALRPTVQNLIPFYFGLRNNLIPDQAVSRTGYEEKYLVDYNTKSFKTSGALHYKITNTVEAIAQANWGAGTSVYTGSDRYSLRNFNIGQYKLELRGEDFMLRGYTTQERSGDSYISSVLGSYINEAAKTSQVWFPQFVGTFAGAKLGGASDAAAYAAARAAADNGRFVPGTPQYETAKNNIMNTNISSGLGARFNDKTNLWHYEGMYNFTNAFNKVVELQIGASYRLFDLNSGGTIFDDLNRKINIKEYGGFAQLGKKMFNDKFKLTLSGRYDKSSNFEGRFTPRVTGVFTVAPNNNIRVSYQTGYRNPTTQNQYIDLSVGGGTTRLIGGLPEILDKYHLYSNPAYTDVSYRAFLASVASSPTGTGDASLLKPYIFDAKGVRPESVQVFELGYKGLLGPKVLIDAYGYYNIYKDFITGVEVYQNNGGDFTKFSSTVNATGNVSAYGGAFGIDYLMGKFDVSGNVSYNKIKDLPSDYINDFNTPTIRYNLGFGSKEIVKNVGFNIAYRWQDKFMWSSTFVTGEVPAFGTMDAQISYKIPSVKSVIKLGGSNIFNKYYVTSFGNPSIGAMYYIGLTFNQ